MKRVLCLITNFVEQVKSYIWYKAAVVQDKKIIIDMLDVTNPKVTIGKDVTLSLIHI
jgi:hypothetical protein